MVFSSPKNQSILPGFYPVLKWMTQKPSNVATARSVSTSMYVFSTTCFDKYFLFHVITGRHKVCYYPKVYFSCHVLVFFWNKWFERSSWFIFYIQNNSALLIRKFQNKPLVYYGVLIDFLNFLKYFSFWRSGAVIQRCS